MKGGRVPTTDAWARGVSATSMSATALVGVRAGGGGRGVANGRFGERAERGVGATMVVGVGWEAVWVGVDSDCSTTTISVDAVPLVLVCPWL